MQKIQQTPFIIAGLAALIISCKSAPFPAGFWVGYAKEEIVERSINQGPWGGSVSLKWNHRQSLYFDRIAVRKFAEGNGWRFLDEQQFPATSTNSLQALTNSPNSNTPQFLPLDSVVMRFDSGWIREEPGTSTTSTAVGYVQISKDGSRMYVFHFWGNG